MAREEVDEKMSSTNGIADGTNGITLRECPHCGNTEALTVKHCDGPGENPDQSRVVCDFTKGGCGASGGVRYTEVEAIEAWNARATRKPTDAVREFAEHVAEDTRRRESKAWAEAATQTMNAALRVVDDCERRIAELEAERDRWRKKAEMLECYIEGPHGWRASCAELEKAVIALYICATDGDCGDCPLNDAHPVKGFRLLCDGIGQLLDGLGIEVD